MKEFFKMMFASMVGMLLSLIILTGFVFLIFTIMIAALEPGEETISQNSVLHLKFNDEIKDFIPSDNPFSNIDFVSGESKQSNSLFSVLRALNAAKKDNKIRGIFLDLGDIPTEFTILEEIREALLDFKESKKFIYAYSKYYSQKSYFIASVADSIFLYPFGDLEFKGLAAEVPYFKGTLDKLEIEPIIIRHGKYKSAVEPFLQNKMSNENKEQINSFLNSVWSYYLECVSKSRKLDVKELNEIAEYLKCENAQKAKDLKLVDQLFYRDQFINFLKSKLNVDSEKELKFVTLKKYLNSSSVKSSGRHSDKIALIYAVGNIIDGSARGEVIASETYARLFKEAREDDDVKAIVFRVNSGGGDGLASDVIYREIELTKGKKPIVVSMGTYAASGGYYISCLGDKILADNSTLTGSIGVFSMWFNFEKLFRNKLGINFEKVKTNTYSDFISANRSLTEFEKKIIARQTDDFYKEFVNKVAKGRNKDFNSIDNIAQGRIWSGKDALNIGLVDSIGGLKTAIKLAAELAKLKEYNIKSYPVKEQYFEKLIEILTENQEENILKNELGQNYYLYKDIKNILEYRGIQARLINKVIIN